MQKIIYKGAFLFCLVFSGGAFGAEEAVISLFDGTSEAATEAKTPQKSDTDKDGGLFSFLNFKNPFSSDKKEKESTGSIEDTLKLADSGNIEAALLAGYSYLYGENGFQTDYEKAFEYYGKAALQNDPTGLNNLGSLYYSGTGIGRSPAKAAILFQKAAALGNADAAINLGFMLLTGNGAKQDKASAMTYFEQASAAGNPIAKFMQGYALYTGSLRPKDYLKAAPLIKQAADEGIDEAQLVVAEIYVNGFGFPQNYNNAVKYLRLAVGQGSTEAMMKLAEILAVGDKYKKDIKFAHVLYNLAAVRGVSEASEKRRLLESKMKIDEVLAAQSSAENFVEKQSDITSYIRQTFGGNLRGMF